jgi:hypothetical protein
MITSEKKKKQLKAALMDIVVIRHIYSNMVLGKQ